MAENRNADRRWQSPPPLKLPPPASPAGIPPPTPNPTAPRVPPPEKPPRLISLHYPPPPCRRHVVRSQNNQRDATNDHRQRFAALLPLSRNIRAYKPLRATHFTSGGPFDDRHATVEREAVIEQGGTSNRRANSLARTGPGSASLRPPDRAAQRPRPLVNLHRVLAAQADRRAPLAHQIRELAQPARRTIGHRPRLCHLPDLAAPNVLPW